MSGLVPADCVAAYSHIEDGDRPAWAKASRKCADGRNAKDTPEIHDLVQKNYDSFFRSIRSEPIGPGISIRPYDEQHDNCRILHPFLSEARLALLDRRRSHRLLANLSWCALAERHHSDAVSGHWGGFIRAGIVRVVLVNSGAGMCAGRLDTAREFNW